MAPKLQNNSKSKALKNIKIRSTKENDEIPSKMPGGKMPNDIIDKEDFENLSEEDKENEDEDDIVDEEQKEEDDDILENDDYGDEEHKDDKDAEQEQEQEGEYDQADGDGSCLYKLAKKIMSDSEEEDDDIVFEDDMENSKTNFVVKQEERETKPVLTKYERVRILGDRAKQLSLGAKPMLLNVNNMNPKDIAKLELERGVIPFIIEKVLPDGRRERWKVSELKIVN